MALCCNCRWKDCTTTLPAVDRRPERAEHRWHDNCTIEPIGTTLRGISSGRRTPSGHITFNYYDPVTDRLACSIQDIDSATLTAFGHETGQSIWTPGDVESSLPSSGHINARTDYRYDGLGRVTQTLGPMHTNDAGDWVRTATWTVYKDADHETWTAQGFATYTDSTGTTLSSYTLVNPISITDYRQGRPRDRPDPGRLVRRSVGRAYRRQLPLAYRFQPHLHGLTANNYSHTRLAATAVYYAIPSGASALRSGSAFLGTATANYMLTTYGYEADYAGTGDLSDYMGRLNKIVAPDGTITRYVYDGRGNVLETWMGTDDTGATDTDPSDNNTNGMVKVASSTYDADGNLTSTTSWADADTSYTTYYQYDWRDRQTGTLGPDGVATLDQYYDGSNNVVAGIDNLGRVTGTQTYAQASYNSGTHQIVTDPLNLRAQTEYDYDNLGRVYESRTYQVDPANIVSGKVIPGDYLPTYTWYDLAGNVIKTETGTTGAFTKTQYDALGRPTVQYTGYNTSVQPETSGTWAEADSVGSNDTILEQDQTWYDAASEPVASATYEQFANGTPVTGILDGTNSYATASVVWYDGIGRQVATANLGREDAAAGTETRNFFNSNGSLHTASDGLPWITEQTPLATYSSNVNNSSSDAYIVAQTQYDSAGRPYRTLDNLGRINETLYDAAGRVVRTIQDYDGLAYGATGSGFATSGNVLETSTAAMSPSIISTIPPAGS